MQDEILKHGNNIHSTMKNSLYSAGKKIKDITIEILIIVFAITLSLWLHNRSDHRHEQKQVKEFLLGLREDLKQTIIDCNDAREDYKEIKRRFSYLSSLKSSVKPDTDSLNRYFSEYFQCPIFHRNSSRYDGFKSSGKLELIENKQLLKNILDLYQEDFPTYSGMLNGWDDHRVKLKDYITNHLVVNNDGSDNKFQVLTMPIVHNLCVGLVPGDQFLEQHDVIIKDAQNIIAEIEKKYRVSD